MARSIVAWLGAAAFSAACAGLSPAQRVQDAANDYAMSVRFGRMDLAQSQIHGTAREAFSRQHASWGSSLRVLDCELGALRMRDNQHADIILSVSWQRIDESEQRFTQIAQRWTNESGSWLLENEERTRGDVGLLGEQATMVAPASRPVHFQTITIR
jgi:hypothetical protein